MTTVTERHGCDSLLDLGYNSRRPRTGVGSTDRGLTHSLDVTKEGLMPNRTDPCRAESNECSIVVVEGWKYQARARIAFEVAGDLDLKPHAWIRATCGNQCLTAAHLVVHQPVKIAYPVGVCVYCGFPAGTKDHLVPRAWTGETRRASVAVVPACADCNRRIGAAATHNVSERRRIAQASLRKRYRGILSAPIRNEAEMSEFGRTLRNFIDSKAKEREAVESRLSWPEDPLYDVRAWQKSGIDDPVALGVIDHPMAVAW